MFLKQAIEHTQMKLTPDNSHIIHRIFCHSPVTGQQYPTSYQMLPVHPSTSIKWQAEHHH